LATNHREAEGIIQKLTELGKQGYVDPYLIAIIYLAAGDHEQTFRTRLNRPVALKVLPPDRVSDPERKRRFVKEARAASAQNHPNIVTIHDIDQVDGVDFITMEYVAGKSLPIGKIKGVLRSKSRYEAS
jgi:serine/threonine protein kinase